MIILEENLDTGNSFEVHLTNKEEHERIKEARKKGFGKLALERAANSGLFCFKPVLPRFMFSSLSNNDGREKKDL